MTNTKTKPILWTPDPDAGFSVDRRPDGGMQVVFHDMKEETLQSWREFALAHLIDSDRLTRNLYDLREIDDLPQKAVQYAVEVNTDPSVRNIRLAVVVSNERVRRAVEEIAALSTPGGVEMEVFLEIKDAEMWLEDINADIEISPTPGGQSITTHL